MASSGTASSKPVTSRQRQQHRRALLSPWVPVQVVELWRRDEELPVWLVKGYEEKVRREAAIAAARSRRDRAAGGSQAAGQCLLGNPA